MVVVFDSAQCLTITTIQWPCHNLLILKCAYLCCNALHRHYGTTGLFLQPFHSSVTCTVQLEDSTHTIGLRCAKSETVEPFDSTSVLLSQHISSASKIKGHLLVFFCLYSQSGAGWRRCKEGGAEEEGEGAEGS